MPSIYARSARSGKLYEVSIAGTQPTPEEQAYIEQRIDNIEGFGAVEAPLPTEEVDDASAAGNLITGFGRGFLTSFTEFSIISEIMSLNLSFPIVIFRMI